VSSSLNSTTREASFSKLDLCYSSTGPSVCRCGVRGTGSSGICRVGPGVRPVLMSGVEVNGVWVSKVQGEKASVEDFLMESFERSRT
jgi:hypothetical protein